MKYKSLKVYQMAFNLAVKIHDLTKNFPKEEKYSLTDQVRRSSRSVCANIAEGYRKRKYPRYFVNKLSDADSENSETMVWLELVVT
jgi:four helix bundle protein